MMENVMCFAIKAKKNMFNVTVQFKNEKSPTIFENVTNMEVG
jgi:hypothetical protein